MERFSQADDIFSRAFWDPEIRSEATERFFDSHRRPLTSWRKAQGFHQKDYALRNAAWHLADLFAERLEDEDRREGFLDPLTALRPGPDEQVELGSPTEATEHIVRVARLFGASAAGVAANDPKWAYSERYSAATRTKPNDLQEHLKRVIVVATPMDEGLISTVPSALASASTGLGYAHDVMLVLTLAQYLINLGYDAVPSMNDTTLAIPYALDAGLGEYGRHGLVITPEHGPRVRFGKVFTNAPLAVTGPISFGVEAFCAVCRRCTNACPPGAIPDGEPTSVKLNRSTLGGVTKWTTDPEKCFGYWTQIMSDCAICIRVCPWNRGSGWSDRLWRRLAGGRGRRLALWWAERTHGTRTRPRDWWGLGTGERD